MTKVIPLCTLLPLWAAIDLATAARISAPGPRMAAIHRVMNALAADGLIRPRRDVSRLEEWQAQREPPPKPTSTTRSSRSKHPPRGGLPQKPKS